MTAEERGFLCSLYGPGPDWDVLEIEGLARLPALRCKVGNINKMGSEKKAAALEVLDSLLEKGRV